MKTLPRLRTTGVIADEIGASLSRVSYVLRTRQHIQPTALAGRLRLYDRQAVAMVRHEINAIDAHRWTVSSNNARTPGDAELPAMPKERGEKLRNEHPTNQRERRI